MTTQTNRPDKNSPTFRVKVQALPHCYKLPKKHSPGAAAFDLYASYDSEWTPVESDEGVTHCSMTYILHTHTVTRISTGVKIEIPKGYCGLVLPRSGLSTFNVAVANSPGLIDSDYRGEIFVAMKLIVPNQNETYEIQTGERIGQLLIFPAPVFELDEVKELTATTRGEGSFGSTGK